MGVDRLRDEGQSLGPPTGKVLGIVDTRAEFDDLARVLESSGFNQLEALWGDKGVNLLERINTFFFSDMEDRVLKRHIDELKAGRFILLIQVPSNRVDEAVRLASEHGARRLVHFGLSTVTWHTK